MSDGNDTLRSALRVLSAETRDAAAEPRVKSNLLSEIRRRRRKALAAKWWPAMALAALVVGVWLGLEKAGPVKAPAGGSAATEVVRAVPAVAEPEVVERPATAPGPVARAAGWSAPREAAQLSPLTPWYVHSGLPQARRGHVVYMQVGTETARLFGLTTVGPVQAEVFLGDDGMARAIRLVRPTEIAKGE